MDFVDVGPSGDFSVEDLGLVDSGDEPVFDNLTSLSCLVLNAPVAMVSIVQPERDRQYFKSSVGLPEPWSSERQTPLSHSFCQHVMARDETFVVPNAAEDPLVAGNGAVTDLGVVAYLGAPVYSGSQPIGALCVIDSKPRSWTGEHIEQLERLASCVSDAIRLKANLIDSERLRASLETVSDRLTDAVDAGEVGLWERDVLTGEFWLSKRFDELHGGETRGWTGLESLIERFHPEDRRALESQMRGGREPNRVYEWVYRFPQPDGTYRWLRSLSTLTEKSDGRSRLAGATVDITVEREREATITDLNAELSEANRDLAEFVRIASHDLQSPMRGIRGLIGLLEEDLGEIPDQAKQRLAQVDGRAIRMQRLLNDLVDYTKVSATATRVEDADPLAIADDIFGSVDCPAGVSLEVESMVDSILVDRVALTTCIRNLVDNATKHAYGQHQASQTGRVLVRFERTADGVCVEVIDNGPGIPEKYMKRIFEPFQSLQSRDVVEGTGIGLAIVQRAIDQVGGRVEVESGPEGGSTFRLIWPEPNPAAD